MPIMSFKRLISPPGNCGSGIGVAIMLLFSCIRFVDTINSFPHILIILQMKAKSVSFTQKCYKGIKHIPRDFIIVLMNAYMFGQ